MCADVSQIHLQYYKKLPRISSVDRQQIKKLQCWEVKKLFTTRFYRVLLYFHSLPVSCYPEVLEFNV